MKKYLAILAALIVVFAVSSCDGQKEVPKAAVKANIVAETQKPEADKIPPVVPHKEEPPKAEPPKTKESQVKKSGPVYGLGYVGNKKTRKFHRVGCGSIAKMKATNIVNLNSRDEAISRGYSPCSRCNP